MPKSLEFFYGGENENFYLSCQLLNLSEENKNFFEFLNRDICEKILTDNKLLIPIETGNIFYDIFNMNGSMYDFLLV